VKLYGGEVAKPGAIIVRQCGTKFHPGFGVRKGKDDTLYSTETGRVVFQGRKIHIDPFEADAPRPIALKRHLAEVAARHN
jgi:large subunit ribosomal protein L27